MIGQPIQSTTNDKDRDGSTNWRTEVHLPPLPQATSPWRAYRDVAAFKRLLLARLMTLEQADSGHLRLLRRNLAAPIDAMEGSSQVGEGEHGQHQVDEDTNRQVAHQSRHLEQAQTMWKHHDFSNRFRAR